MYADTGLFSPCMHNFAAQDFQQLGDYCKTQKPNDPMNNLIPTSKISEYYMGGDGDLFKNPQPIIEESALDLDHMTAAMPLISCNEDVITSQELKAADIELFQNEQLLEVLYECEKDLIAQAAIGTPLVEGLDIKGAAIESNFLDFPGIDFDSVYGMRRAFSEGDIKALGNGNVSVVRSPVEPPLIFSSCSTEDRREKLSRYRNKKTRGTLEGKSSMLAGRLLPTVNQGSAGGSQGRKNPTTARDNDSWMTRMKLPSEAGM
ncbi:HSP20-like chaperones superfamily protein isoform 1 [Hibiscus syriacus]|uniref:HSP20-like chaperones superfamily protein isoform 1 n=1 Tax=Hibiscus syriacus TaxID=106335 RepID=A0A6A2WRB1_HIBSY|nr:HSP20-like chaperones superfamily protein isoform 1 [Hibiscus syriacus]